MGAPNDRRYLQSHEWHKVEGGLVVIGISKSEVDELTDITFLDIKQKTGAVREGQSVGEIEWVKAASELYAGIDGTVSEINQAAIQNPAVINEDPYGKGWLVKIKPADPGQVNKLLSAVDYDSKTGA